MSNPAQPANDTRLMALFVAYLLRTLEASAEKGGPEIPAATLSVIRQFLSDNSITIASVRRGDFGQVVQTVAEEFPFNDDGTTRGDSMMGTGGNVVPIKAN